MKQSLLIVGPDIQTRGIGGVTVHVQRLKEYLENHGYLFDFQDSRSGFWKLLSEIAKHKIIHYHLSNPLLQFFLVFYGRIINKRVIMTLHGDYGRFGCFKNWLVRNAIRMATVPIVINEKSYNACKKYNSKLQLIPAFIPPQKKLELNPDITNVLNGFRNKGKTIVSTNASHASIDKDGNDIYGIGFLINYFRDSPNKALVISDSSGDYSRRYNVERDSIRNGDNTVYFIDGPHPFFEVLKLSDLFIRNTSTDGDALSVKEALFLGLPTYCSDSVDRPKGVKLFKYSDKQSLDGCFQNKELQTVHIDNGAEQVLNTYIELDKR